MNKALATPPQDIQTAVEILRQAGSQKECLLVAYEMLTQKYHGNRLNTLLRFYELWPYSADKLWSKNGFMHCINLNRLLCTLLVESGHFTDRDIATHWTLLWYISPHQFLTVSTKNREIIHIDLWAETYDIPFGDYAHGFHVYGKKSAT